MDYKEEIRKMCAPYDEMTKEDMRAVLNDLYTMGFDFEWIYTALLDILNRRGGYSQWRNLLFFRDFQQEISDRVLKEHKRKEEKIRNAKIIMAQQEALKNREKIIIERERKPRKPKKVIDLAAIALMED